MAHRTVTILLPLSGLCDGLEDLEFLPGISYDTQLSGGNFFLLGSHPRSLKVRHPIFFPCVVSFRPLVLPISPR